MGVFWVMGSRNLERKLWWKTTVNSSLGSWVTLGSYQAWTTLVRWIAGGNLAMRAHDVPSRFYIPLLLTTSRQRFPD